MNTQNTYSAAETARRFTENAADATRLGAEQGLRINRQMIDAWATNTEATLKATFELQNAAIAAGRTVLEATGTGNMAYMEQWADVVRRAQQATLDAWQVNKQAAKKLGTVPATS